MSTLLVIADSFTRFRRASRCDEPNHTNLILRLIRK